MEHHLTKGYPDHSATHPNPAASLPANRTHLKMRYRFLPAVLFVFFHASGANSEVGCLWAADTDASPVTCAGSYPHHLQGICTDSDSIYWSFTTTLVKTDLHGRLQKKIPVTNHHGDLCILDGKLYVAVNLGKFNDPAGNADSWVYVYDADSLEEVARHPTPEAFHGAGGIGVLNDRFFVVGGLPDQVDVNYVYEYDRDFKFQKKHVIASGHTLMGIQTATFAHGRWWFGCYGDPKTLLVADAEFQLLGRYEFDCSLGIEGWSAGRVLIASGSCAGSNGCTGSVSMAVPDAMAGLKLLPSTR